MAAILLCYHHPFVPSGDFQLLLPMGSGHLIFWHYWEKLRRSIPILPSWHCDPIGYRDRRDPEHGSCGCYFGIGFDIIFRVNPY